SALAQQHGLAAVEQTVDRRTPLLEPGRPLETRRHQFRGVGVRGVEVRVWAATRARTSGRRSGGTVLGGCRRGVRSASSRVVVAATSATAVSNTSTLAPAGRVIPLTLRTY